MALDLTKPLRSKLNGFAAVALSKPGERPAWAERDPHAGDGRPTGEKWTLNGGPGELADHLENGPEELTIWFAIYRRPDGSLYPGTGFPTEAEAVKSSQRLNLVAIKSVTITI